MVPVRLGSLSPWAVALLCLLVAGTYEKKSITDEKEFITYEKCHDKDPVSLSAASLYSTNSSAKETSPMSGSWRPFIDHERLVTLHWRYLSAFAVRSQQ